MEYAELFSGISLGTLIVWGCAAAFIGGAINKFLEKYRKYKNGYEDKEKAIESHSNEINNLNTKVDSILVSIDEIIATYNQRESKRLRREILKFSDKLRDGKIPSQDSFEDIFDCNESYEELIHHTGTKNGFTEREMAFIQRKYDDIYGTVSDIDI